MRSADRTLRDPPLEWICSGLPTEQPAPDQLLPDLLRGHGLLLFPEDPVQPETRSRRLIGFATRDPTIMRLALALRRTHTSGDEHPLLAAAQQIQDQARGAVLCGHGPLLSA